MSIVHRIEVPGGTYHVNANALHGMSLFRDEIDRLGFYELLLDEVKKRGWKVLAYTLMTTHYHLLLSIKTELSSGFHRLHSMYAREFNRRHGRRGVVWQKRFHDELVTSDRHLFETIRYLARNAPRAGMCEKPEDWPWSSYGSAIGLQPPDPLVDEAELLGLFSADERVARKRLAAYVNEPDPRVRRRQTCVRRASDAQQ
jgi:REP element-mobilizing transposase RayT